MPEDFFFVFSLSWIKLVKSFFSCPPDIEDIREIITMWITKPTISGGLRKKTRSNIKGNRLLSVFQNEDSKAITKKMFMHLERSFCKTQIELPTFKTGVLDYHTCFSTFTASTSIISVFETAWKIILQHDMDFTPREWECDEKKKTKSLSISHYAMSEPSL